MEERSIRTFRRFDDLKNRLLDLGRRNRMINYRETKRATLRIEEPGYDKLFNALALDERSLSFQRPLDETNDRRTWQMLQLLTQCGAPMEVNIGDIRTAVHPHESAQTLRSLRQKTKTMLEEQGVNCLYLSFGFLEWQEHASPTSPWMRSPLLMMPVTLTHESLRSPYIISRADDDIEINPTLDYRFNRELGIDLPTFELKDETSIVTYLDALERIADERGWRLYRDVSLGLTSFLKISMYHDLEKHGNRALNHPIIRALCGDDEAIRRDAITPGSPDSVHPADCYQVLSADSSQQEAIRLSREGVSFVMQGPPGTGKSQTITNIISEALSDGRRVLFVSEKAAALQVVMRRLQEAELDDFCLTLHSHKASKKDILAQLRHCLSLPHTRVTDAALTALSSLVLDRETLNRYARELHEKDAAMDQTLYGAIGEHAKLADAPQIRFTLPDMQGVTRSRFHTWALLAKRLDEARRSLTCPLSENPWRGCTANAADADFLYRFRQDTADLPGAAEALLAACQRAPLNALTPVHLTNLTAADQAFSLCADLPDADVRWLDDAYRDEMQRFVRSFADAQGEGAAVTGAHQHLQELGSVALHAAILQEYLQLPATCTAEGAAKLAQCARTIHDGPPQLNPAWFDPVQAWQADELLALYEANVGRIRQLQNELDARHQADAQAIKGEKARCDAALRCFASSVEPVDILLALRGAKAELGTLAEAADKAEALHRREKALLKSWEPEVFRLDAEGMLRRFKTDYASFLTKLLNRGRYNADMRALKGASRQVLRDLSDTQAVAVLQELKEIRQIRDWFQAQDAAVKTGLSAMRKACEARGQQLAQLAAMQEAHTALEHRAEELTRLFCGEAWRMLDPEGHARQRLRREAAFASAVRGWYGEQGVPEQVANRLAKGEKALRAASSHCAALLTEARQQQLASAATALTGDNSPVRDWRELANRLADAEQHVPARCGAYFGADAARLTWGEAARRLQSVGEMRRLASQHRLPEEFLRALCTAENRPDAQFRNLFTAAKNACGLFAAHFDADEGLSELPLADLTARYRACAENPALLGELTDLRHMLRQLRENDLGDFARNALSLPADADLERVFRREFYRQWISLKIQDYPALSGFLRMRHEQTVRTFCDMDDEQLGVARQRIRSKLISRYPDINAPSAPGDELSILRHQLGLKSRHMAVRRLFGAIPNLLLTLKPCFMMSPLSVSYFLAAESYKFDLVIFDEASQIFPQDALGSIMRGAQVIIAGDTKQMPPSNFFAASMNSAEDYDFDDEDEDEPIGDSILEEADKFLPGSTLLWHYRSRDESLIAFSNREIYHGQLITFPGVRKSAADSGVEAVYVADGVYEPRPRNINQAEADRCVALIREHIERHPDRSLGVIAFSEKQQQAITHAVERFRLRNPQYEWFFAEDRDEPFFVKNLENVQGDERDTVLFSICYARTQYQRDHHQGMSMRFGPLGKDGGERRLNVAITRARQNVKLITSILPEDIDMNRTGARGVRMLRSYLLFAMTGAAAEASHERSEQADALADAIARLLTDSGYQVHREIGQSAFRIDLAVVHPQHPDRYAAGILCDGEGYARAKTARDRDHLRQDVLRGMGWTLHRVWSAAWLKEPDRERQLLLDFVARCCADAAEEAADSPEQAAADEPIAKDIVEPVAETVVQMSMLPPDGTRYGFTCLTEADWREARKPGAAIRDTDVIRHIVRIEQPMHLELLCRRMAGALGNEKVTVKVRNAVDAALLQMADITNEGGFLSMRDAGPVQVRIPREGENQREVDMIAPAELRLAMQTVAARTIGLKKQSLIDETARALGYQRRGAKIQQALSAAFDALVGSGVIFMADGKVNGVQIGGEMA